MTIKLHTDPLGWTFSFAGRKYGWRTRSKYQTKGTVRKDAVDWLHEVCDQTKQPVPVVTFEYNASWEGAWP